MEGEPQVPDNLSTLSQNEKLNLYQQLGLWAIRCRDTGNVWYGRYRISREDEQIYMEMIKWVTASIIADADLRLVARSLSN